jgi:hypothetical protein
MAKKKTEPTRYEIDSFEKLINVANKNNFESLSKDLIAWLWYTVHMAEDIRNSAPKKYTKDKTNWDLCKYTFIWIDDGQSGIKTVRIKNNFTGEVKELKVTSL